MPKLNQGPQGPVEPELEARVKERVAQSRLKVLNNVPFFGHLLLKMKVVVTRRVPLAGVTPARELLINPEWAETTDFAELSATVVHEVLHAALGYWDRQQSRTLIVNAGGRPVALWNLAHDYVVNLIIRDMASRGLHPADFRDPEKWKPPGLIDSKYDGWSGEEVYDDLLTKVQDPPPTGGGGSGEGEGAGRPTLPGVNGDKSDVLSDAQGGGGEHGDSEGESRGLSSGELKENESFWKQAVVEAAMMQKMAADQSRGKLSAALERILKDITEPRVSWVEVLARWVGEHGRRADFTWRRPSRRSDAAGEFLPSMQKFGVDDVCVLWDSSGSMGNREEAILSEVLGIVNDLGLSLRVIVCDCRVFSDQSGVQAVEDVKFGGGGGSDFGPAFKLLDDEQYEGVVVAFTDGYIGVPDQKPHHLREVLWCIWAKEQKDIDPTGGKWGEVILVDEDGTVRK